MSSQVEMVISEELVSSNHIYRKFKDLWDFSDIKNEVEKIEIDSDHKGFGTFRLFLCLLIQFTEDLSDRELERYLETPIQLNGFATLDWLRKRQITECLLIPEEELEPKDYLQSLTF